MLFPKLFDAIRGLRRNRKPTIEPVHDRMGYRTRWKIRRFADDAAFARDEAYNESIIDGNVCLNAGIGVMLDLMAATAAPTAFSNAAAYLGVGDGGPANLGGGGTVTFTNASANVTGSGTTFTSDVVANDWLVGADGLLYQVQSVTDNTHLVLTATYAGTTASGYTTQKCLRELATQTNLQAGTNKKYNAMSATYPQRSNQTVTWQAVFASADANYAWREFLVANGSAGTTALNRKVSYQGVKASGQTWTLQLQITWS